MRLPSIGFELPDDLAQVMDGLVRFAEQEILPRHERHADLLENPRRRYLESGALSPEDYREFVLPHSRSVLSGLAETDVPVIHFATGSAGMLKLLAQAGGDAWRAALLSVTTF